MQINSAVYKMVLLLDGCYVSTRKSGGKQNHYETREIIPGIIVYQASCNYSCRSYRSVSKSLSAEYRLFTVVSGVLDVGMLTVLRSGIHKHVSHKNS